MLVQWTTEMGLFTHKNGTDTHITVSYHCPDKNVKSLNTE